MTDEIRRDRTAQPDKGQQSGRSEGSSGEARESSGQRDVAHDKRRRPSPRPRPDTAGQSSARQPGPQGGQQAGTRRSGGQAADRRVASGEGDVQDKGRGTSDTKAKPAGDGSRARRTKPEESEQRPVAGGFAAELEALRKDLDERTRDLQRLTAEYANYRRRVERDRALVVEQATGAVLAELLGVLDDIDRARKHGDLVGPFGAVADQLISGLNKLGLSVFAAPGDEFDPSRHEAVAHSHSSKVTEPTCVEVFRHGYTLGERLLRPALVAVAEPSDEEPEGEGAEGEELQSKEPADSPSEPAASADEAAPAAVSAAVRRPADVVADTDSDSDEIAHAGRRGGSETPTAAEQQTPHDKAADSEKSSAESSESRKSDAEAADSEAAADVEADVEVVDADAVEAEVVEGELVDPEAAAVAGPGGPDDPDSSPDSPDGGSDQSGDSRTRGRNSGTGGSDGSAGSGTTRSGRSNRSATSGGGSPDGSSPGPDRGVS